MSIRYILLIVLALLFWRHGHAQYPATGNKQRLGYQTTGDGLVYRGSGAPAYTPTGLNNAWVYIDTVTRNLYTYVGGSWQLISGGGSEFDGHVDSLVFNTNVTVIDSTAKMHWDANSETITVGVNGGASYQMGEELYYPLVINKSGATILNGQCVMVDTATLVTGDHVRIILARNGATYPSNYIMGVATTDIPNDSTGLVTWFGYVREVKHTDIAQTGVTLVPGNILYPSATEPGRYTNVQPATPAHKSTIALVVRKPSANNITLLVRPWLAPRLADLSDVNTTSVTGLSVLRYNSTAGTWDASATPGIVAADTASMLSPYLRKVDTLSLSNRINLKLNIADTTAMLAPYAKGSSTAGRVAYWSGTRDLTGSANLTWTEANKTLGINTTTTSGANLIIKNSQEPTRATVVATQTFGADTTNWTRGAGWTFNGTQAVATAATGALTYTPALTITSGNAYEVTYTISNYSAGTLTLAIGNTTYALPAYNLTNNVVVVLPTSATGGFRFTTSTFTGNLDNVTVVQVSNPAPVLISAQGNNTASIYNGLVMPNSSTRGLNGSGRYATGSDNNFYGTDAGYSNTSGIRNNFFGFNAGYYNTTGSDNNFVGTNAGRSNTIGVANNFFGTNAGRSNTTGIANNFVGFNAGYYNTTGSRNNFFGTTAGNDNTTGSENNFFGYEAGRINTTGVANNFFGFYAGRNNATGSNNNFFGYNAGYNNRTGNNNTAIGQNSMYNPTLADTLTGSNNIAIGFQVANNIRATASRNTIMGYDIDVPVSNGNDQLVISNLIFGINANATGTNYPTNGRVGIRQNTPVYVFDINSTDAIRVPVGTTVQRPTGAAGVLRYNTDSTKIEFHNGTAWSGLQNTITNPVTGTGAAGQVAYWSGTGTQTGSNNLFWDNTNARLGIGTNAPTDDLHVRKDVNDFAGIELTNPNTGVNVLTRFEQMVGATTSSNANYRLLNINTAPKNYTNAFVGGTYGAGGTTVLMYGGTDTTNNHITHAITNLSGVSEANFNPSFRWVKATTNNYTAANELMRLNATGLGIGTNSPARQLDVVGVARIQRSADDAAIILQRTGSGTKAFLFGVGASGANNGYFTIADGAADGSTGFTRRFYIDNTGKIGIASTSPAYSFDINATDAIRIPVGTTAQQPTGAAGIVRYNSSNAALEYHNGITWKTVANTDNTVQTFNFSLNIYNANDTVKNITSPANFFLVPANLNGYCIDSYQVKALSGTGTADVQLAKNGTGGNVQAISGTTTYNKDVNVTLATGDVIQGQVFNLSAGATLVGLGLTIEIKATCN